MRYRRQLFVDPKVQGALVLRVVGYWFFCLLTMSLALLLWRLFTGPARLFYLQFDELWYWYGPAAISSLLVLPLVIIDCVRTTNRFAGPLYRLRRELRRLAAGENVQPIHFRTGDFWQDFAEEFNAVVKRVDQLNQRGNQADKVADKTDRFGVKDNTKLTKLSAGEHAEATPLIPATTSPVLDEEDVLFEPAQV